MGKIRALNDEAVSYGSAFGLAPPKNKMLTNEESVFDVGSMIADAKFVRVTFRL